MVRGWSRRKELSNSFGVRLLSCLSITLSPIMNLFGISPYHPMGRKLRESAIQCDTTDNDTQNPKYQKRFVEDMGGRSLYPVSHKITQFRKRTAKHHANAKHQCKDSCRMTANIVCPNIITHFLTNAFASSH